MSKSLRELTNELRKKGFTESEAKSFLFDVIIWWNRKDEKEKR